MLSVLGFASAGLTHRLATVPLQACTMSRPAVHCCMASAEGSLFDAAVPQPTNDILSDDVPANVAGIFCSQLCLLAYPAAIISPPTQVDIVICTSLPRQES